MCEEEEENGALCGSVTLAQRPAGTPRDLPSAGDTNRRRVLAEIDALELVVARRFAVVATPFHLKEANKDTLESSGRKIAVLQIKKSDAVTWQRKKETWERIAEEFADRTGVSRPWTALRDKYDNMKRKFRNDIEPGRRKTYGDTPFFSESSVSEKVGDLIGITGGARLENQFNSDASRTVKEVSNSIAALSREYIKFGEPDEVLEEFHRIANFPRVMGAVGCTHIQVQSPAADQSEMYRNRSGFYSINVQAVSDAKLKIQDLVARWPGSTQESIIFDNSRLKKRFEADEFGNAFPLGDCSCVLRKYVMTPLRKPIAQAEKLYNESQCRTHKVVSKCFEAWKHRFPVLSFGMRINIDTAKVVIVACAVLHNIAISVKDPEPPTDEDLPAESLESCVEPYKYYGPVNSFNENRRNQFIKEYFS